MTEPRTLAPTWASIMPLLIEIIARNPDDSAAALAQAELMRCAEIADCAIERDRSLEN